MDLTTDDRAVASHRVVRTGSQYEFRMMIISRWTSTSDVRQLLADEAEHGRWELARSRLYPGGERRVWLRRKVIRVRSTLSLADDEEMRGEYDVSDVYAQGEPDADGWRNAFRAPDAPH